MPTREITIGAFVFGLTANEDGTYTSTVLRESEYGQKQEPADEVIHLKIPSNSDPDKEYDVDIYPDGLVHCNCVGWGFRHHCSHCDAAMYIVTGDEQYLNK